MGADDIARLAAGPYGSLFLLVLAVMAFVTGKVVAGHQYTKLEQKCERLEELLWSVALPTAEHATDVAETVAKRLRGGAGGGGPRR